MQALLEAGLPVSAVISNVAGAKGLESAAQRGIATRTVEHRQFASREAFDAALAGAIDEFGPRLVTLAGFMRVLTPGFVGRYRDRMLNIHPSLLPQFPGLHTHRRALEAGLKQHGCTVHFVTPLLDHGPIVIQAAVPVRAGDTEETLAARVLRQEHVIYPRAVRWFLDDRLVIEGDRVRVKGEEENKNAQMVVAAD
jgi:phosphoribosylglycinamide formyltransferase 1